MTVDLYEGYMYNPFTLTVYSSYVFFANDDKAAIAYARRTPITNGWPADTEWSVSRYYPTEIDCLGGVLATPCTVFVDKGTCLDVN